MKELAPLFVILLAVVTAAAWKTRLRQGGPWLATRLSRQRGTRPLEIVDLVHLSNHSSVQLIRAIDKVLVVGVSNSAITLLETFPAADSSINSESVRAARSQS